MDYFGHISFAFEWRYVEHFHLKYFPDYQFEWKLLTRAPEYTRKRKNLEVFLIKCTSPSLNEQSNTELIVLFRKGVTS